jgi:hypothetical protein
MVKQLEARVRDAGLANVTCEQADLYNFDAVYAGNARRQLGGE